MERLLYSSSPNPLNTQFKQSPFLPKIRRYSSPTLNISYQNRDALYRFNSISCRKAENTPSFVHVARQSDNSPLITSPGVDFRIGLVPKSGFLQQIAEGAVELKKAVSARTLVLLSAIIVFLIHPVFAPSALATFQTASNSGSPIGAKLIRTELLSSAWTGFFAGCLHTLSGPDHLAALAPLSIGRTRLESAAVGALWGCGHDAGQLIFGLIFLLLKDRLHIEIIQTWGTRVVGLTLLIIGGMGIKEASEVPTPCVALENTECDVSSGYEAVENSTKTGKKKIGFATFATGIVHGLQPDALMMVLPALALPSRLAGGAFLVMFLLGTVFAMGSYTVFIGSFSNALKDRVPKITEKLTWASSLVAIALGFAILISQFFGYSLY